MRSARELYNEFNSKKEIKYQQMIKHQEKIIADAVGDGNRHGSRLFIFTDKELFHGIEREWFTEFYAKAKKELEDAGYTINGVCVCW